MNVAITGASGFIGSAVADSFIAAGNKVCILARPDSTVKNWNLRHPSVQILTYTSLDDKVLSERLQEWKPGVFVNLAWKGVGGGDRNQSYQFIDNVTYTLQSVRLAAETGCTQWVGMGSQAEYGIHNAIVSENSACNPVTAYGKAKLAAGIASLGMCDSLHITGTWARIFSSYGPGDHAQTFINYIIKSFLASQAPVLTACQQKWDYLFITDTASAIVSLVENSCKGVFNIGSGNTIVLKEIVEQLKEDLSFKGQVLYGSKEYAPQQIMHLQADVSKLKQHTKWEPLVSVREGLQQTVLAIKENVLHESI